MHKRIAFASLIATLVALLATACTAGSGGEPDVGTARPGPPASGTTGFEATQVNEARGIAIEATWVTAEHLAEMGADSLAAYPLEQYVLVHLAFTTHSGDLNQYDLVELSSLNITGDSVAAKGWVSLSDDSHHREGVLIFARLTFSGPVELVLRDIGGEPQRLFRWEAIPEA